MILTIEGFLGADQVARVREAAAGASFQDGRATAGPTARKVKNNLQARRDDPALRGAYDLVTAALQRSVLFQNFVMPHRTLPPIFSRYQPGMQYGDHVDNAVMPGTTPIRSDLSFTLFLSEPSEYDGGELVIDTDLHPQKVKLAGGGLVVYPSSTLHRVEPVTRGERLVVISWIQSLVRDHTKRQMLFEFGRILRWLQETAPEARETLQLSKLRTNLLRMWAEV